MSPRTTTASHPSSLTDSKEVPRAALNFTSPDIMELSSPLSSPNAQDEDQILQNLVEDSIQGLKALAASAAASIQSDRISSPPESVELDEDQVLGSFFTCVAEEKTVAHFYSKYCASEHVDQAQQRISSIISKADALLQEKGISMTLENILHFYLQRLIQQESIRTGKTDFAALLLDDQFISASATVIILLPRLVSILLPVEEVSAMLGANLFDVLLAIEPLLRAMPELLKLPETQRRLKRVQQALLEEAVWRDETLFKLLKSELKVVNTSADCPFPISTTLSGIRSSQKALESLSGFPTTGSHFTRLELFFRMYLRLAANRLQHATLRLGSSQEVTQLAWEFFYHLIQNDTAMFKNRHLNQILLATIYCCSRLLEQERSLQQISQVLPSTAQNNTKWLSRVATDDPAGSCDFYTFYNEIFVPPLRKRIESFLNRKREEGDGDKWILDGLFTTAPFPLSPVHQIGGNVTLNRLSQPKPKYRPTSAVTRYEWARPYKTDNDDGINKSHNYNTHNISFNAPHNIIHNHPQTPFNTSLLLNGPSSPQTTDFHDFKRRPHEESDNNDDRMRRVARRLDFSEE